MTHLVVREYFPDDLLAMEMRPRASIGVPEDQFIKMASFHKRAGPSFTVVDSAGWIVFCAGINDWWPGLGELWGAFSPLAEKYPHTLRVADRLIDYCWATYGYRRLQCSVDPAWPAAVRFIEHLGFSRECIMRSFGRDGSAQALYARVED